MTLTDEQFQRFSELFYSFSGIKLKEYKKYLMEYRLSKFVGEYRPYQTYEEFYQALLHDKTGKLKKQFVEVLTTNYTYFFRESVHFDFLAHYLKESVSSSDYIRLWSAGCASGEEAYTMAIVALETIPSIYHYDFKILATDISYAVLEVALQGVYHYSKLKNMDDALVRKYFDFDEVKKTFTVKESVKKLIAFRYLNLMDNFPFSKQFDVVFLRNVLIYFDNREKEYILRKIYDYMKPGGYLILGMSESLVGLQTPFVSLKNSIYRREE